MTTFQECLWQDKAVAVTGIVSRSGKAHRYLRKMIGRTGWVLREAKNGMLLVEFKKGYGRLQLSVPAGCLTPVTDIRWAGKKYD